MIEALEAEKIPYMMVGALSSSVFGIPRATKDVDIVLQLQTREPLRRLEERLSQVVNFDPQPFFERTGFGSVRGREDFPAPCRVVRPDQAPGIFAISGGCDRAKTALGQGKGFGGRLGRISGSNTRQIGHELHHAVV